MSLNSILSISPHVEVLVRHLYWSTSFLISSKDKILKKEKPAAASASFPAIIEKMKDRGAGEGSLLVVHSSMDALSPAGVNAFEVIDGLIKLIGDGGTLAMPAFPLYKNELQGRDRLTKSISGMVFEYNLKRTIAWTGKIPNRLLKYPGAVRSKHPLNSMSAVGPLAGRMMRDNLKGEKPLPCGENSSWKFCADNNAKVIGLGIDLTHSLTMIHVAEDIKADSWPVKNWYRDRRCVVIDNNERREVVVRERDPKWGTRHFAERTLCKDLLKEGILTRDTVDGILLETVDARQLVEFLCARNHTGYPYFWLPKK